MNEPTLRPRLIYFILSFVSYLIYLLLMPNLRVRRVKRREAHRKRRGKQGMWAWGKREQGECGSGSEPPPEEAKKPLLEPTPTDCTSLLGPIVALAAGEGHSLALDSLGNVYVWGRTREGQAARVSQVPQHAPLLVQQLSHEIVTSVACGASSCFAVAASGRCYTWGSVLKRSGGQLHHDAAGYGRSFSELSEATQRMLKLSVGSSSR